MQLAARPVFIASPLSVWLMGKFTTADHVGVAETFIVLGVVYFCLHDGRRRSIVRVPAPGWKPAGYVAPAQATKLITTQRRLRLRRAEDAAVLADLVGALPQRDRRHRRARPGLGHEPGNVPRPDHAGRGGGLRRPDEPVQHGRPLLLGLDVGLHRRKNTYFVFMVLGFVLYCTVPYTGSIGSVALFVCASWSSSACTAAASRPCRPICGTCSARATSARSTACC